MALYSSSQEGWHHNGALPCQRSKPGPEEIDLVLWFVPWQNSEYGCYVPQNISTARVSQNYFAHRNKIKLFFLPPSQILQLQLPRSLLCGIMHCPCIVSCDLKQWKCLLKCLLSKYFPGWLQIKKRLFRHLHNIRYPSAQSHVFMSFFSSNFSSKGRWCDILYF